MENYLSYKFKSTDADTTLRKTKTKEKKKKQSKNKHTQRKYILKKSPPKSLSSSFQHLLYICVEIQ